MFEISAQSLNPEALRKPLAHPAAGGVVFFEGWIRDRNDGREVVGMRYEAYEPLAVKEGNRILEEAAARWPVLQARVVHRVGTLAVGDMAVWVGVACAHRREAFEACQYIIDELKQRVPIWKQEAYPEGETTWLQGAG